MELKDKIVLVTGSSSGIGQAIAIAFADKGATVLVHYHNHKEGGEKTLSEVSARSKGFLYQADLTKSEDIRNLFAAIKRDVPTIDILVNNAGNARHGDLFDEEAWKFQHDNIFQSVVYGKVLPSNFPVSMYSFAIVPSLNLTSIKV